VTGWQVLYPPAINHPFDFLHFFLWAAYNRLRISNRVQMNKIAFITGASSGIGKACAEKFASGLYDVIITGRRKEMLIQIQGDIQSKYGIQVLPLCFDVQKESEVKAAVASLIGNWKKISVLVNNAGLALGRDFFDEALMEDWETMIDTNVKGLLYVSRAIIPLMKSIKNGHIINIGSTAGKEVYEKGNVYCATKFAVDAISRGMRIDLLSHGIKVTAVHPGAAETEFSKVRFKGNMEEFRKVYEGFTPLTGPDIAEVIYYCTTLPQHVCINDLVMTSLAQANSYYTYRGEFR
jgi:NADP-dependent 3-hydroxy acid dehydrogenase YdfG